jgi:hypothetical protein
MLPFKQEKINDKEVIRIFSQDTDDEEFKWHRDAEDRIVEILETTDWKFQFDNKLPQKLEGTITIPKGVYHRVIKGTNDLKVKITFLV